MEREPEDSRRVRRYYDALAEGEWTRLTNSARGRVSLEVHRRFLRRFVAPDARVLEVGAGPGRFTLELAALGARAVVTDVSAVQLALNEERLRGTLAEGQVERRELLDVCDTSRYADGEFDAVVAFGGPLSYAFERTDEAMRGLLRIVRPDGIVVASVMSLLGTWRYFLGAITDLDEQVGETAGELVMRTGDMRHVVANPCEHVCQMFRWSDLEALLERTGSRAIAASASNWASLGDARALARLEADPARWERFLAHEVTACGEPGAVDGGTHILFAAAPANGEVVVR
ncbi:MAG: class I SAM-dependent methyltransferase [Actinomycetota bacterium]|nr:class I SAM-dependent methyltransferase [Actinomycetota bacterium]